MRSAPDLKTAIEWAKAGEQSMVRCEAHSDNQASLHIAPGTEQPVVLWCHAGCETADILSASGLTIADIANDQDELDGIVKATDEWTPAGPASHRYSYTDEDGKTLFEVLRIPLPGNKKTFRQRHPDPSQRSGWKWNMDNVRRVLYRLPEVLAAKDEGRIIRIVEGEKDAETLRRHGETATTSPMGAGKWQEEFSKVLAGSNVVIMPDADATGRAHAREVRESLLAVGCSVSVLEPMEGAKDATAHFEKGGTLEDFIETVPEEEDEEESYGVDILSVVERSVSPASFVIPGVLAQGDRLLLTGIEGRGKDLMLSTPLLTTDGWTTMGAIETGQKVFDENGHPCNVVAKSPVYLREGTAYRVQFSDGSEIVAGDTHEWLTYTVWERESRMRQDKRSETMAPRGSDQRHKALQPQIRTTKEILSSLRARPTNVANHAIPVAGALEYPEAELPFPAYTFGVWLGDGTSDGGSLTIADRDSAILEGVESEGWPWHGVPSGDNHSCRTVRLDGAKVAFREMGVLGNKHIPGVYKRASVKQRMDLLAGICDTDGYCGAEGMKLGRGGGASRIEVVFTDEALANDVLELVRSLGIVAHCYEGDATIDGRFISRKWRVVFQSEFNPFRHAGFKADRWRPLRTQRTRYRYITGVVPIEEEIETQCIEVDSSSHLYLAGEELIPTHNSKWLRQIGIQVAAGIHPWTGMEIPPKKVLFIDGENHPDQVLVSWQDLVGLAARHGHPVQRGHFTVLEEWDHEIDLTSEEGHAWLLERIYAYRPDLVCVGPLYAMAGRDLKEDETVRKLKRTINDARSICGSAFIMEHHAPHRSPQDRERSIRPYGSSTFLKWPDFGYGLKPTEDENIYEFQKTRYPRVRSRDFPEYFRIGKPGTLEWPWTPCVVDNQGNIY